MSEYRAGIKLPTHHTTAVTISTASETAAMRASREVAVLRADSYDSVLNPEMWEEREFTKCVQ